MGATETSTGGEFWTEKLPGNVDVPPPGIGLVTVTSRDPTGAFRGIVTSTLSCVEFTTLTGPIVNPLPTLTVVNPLMKSDPLNVRVTLFPLPPTIGEIVVTVGIGFNTVNAPESVTGPFPPEFDTQTSLGPAAAAWEIAM